MDLTQFLGSPMRFRSALKIEHQGKLVPFSKVMDEYQRVDFEACDKGWLRAAGYDVSEPVTSRAYIERSRGHSKSTDLAISLVWFLAFPRKMVRAYASAADRDQAKLLRDAMAKLVSCNPWLSDLLDVQAYKVANVTGDGFPGSGSSLEIMSCDVSSSYGLIPDAIVCDELTHWPIGSGEGMWHSLFSSSAKRDTCHLQIISNAGRDAGVSWQWSVREMARSSPSWYFSRLDGPKASWISPAILEEQRKGLPESVFKRLWLNSWTAGGDALPQEDLDACINQDAEMLGNESGWKFCAGLDLGVKRDFSALVVLGVSRELQRIRLAMVRAWRPQGGSVDLESVRAEVLAAHKRFRLARVAFDPHQAALLSQQLQASGVRMDEMVFAGSNLTAMATNLLEAVTSRRLDLYPESDLIKELRQLNIEERPYGFRLVADRCASHGHGDRATALAIALPYAMELLRARSRNLQDWINAGCLQ